MGDGPGEFRSPNWVGRCGQRSVTVFDYTHDRLTEISDSGEILGTRAIPSKYGYTIERVRCHETGRYVIALRDLMTIPDDKGLYSAPWLLQTMVGLDGEIRDIGTACCQARYRYEHSDMRAPLGEDLAFASGADRVYLSRGSQARVVVVQVDTGDTLEVVTWEPSARRVDDELRSAVIEDDLDRVRDRVPSNTLKERRAAWQETQFPDALPEVYDLLLDTRGETLWIQVSKPPFGGHGLPSVMVGITSTSAGPPIVLRLPQEYTPFEVTGQHFLGRVRDSFGAGSLGDRALVLNGR